MKKIFQLTIFVLMLAVTSMASAASEKSTIEEGADLSNIHKLAIGTTNYYQTDSNAPTYDEFVDIIYEASKVGRTQVISNADYRAAAKKISKFKIELFEPSIAQKMSNQGISDLADAYLVTTIANPNRPNFFFEVYDAKTNQLLYTYQTVLAKTSRKNAKNFQEICETFFKKFDQVAVKQAKKR